MDPAFREKLMLMLQAQRNAAHDNHAAAEARCAQLMEENATLKLKIAEMEAASEAGGLRDDVRHP
jgi:hypothetical protein